MTLLEAHLSGNLLMGIDISGGNSLSFLNKKGGETNAGVLCEMPCQKGNEGC